MAALAAPAGIAGSFAVGYVRAESRHFRDAVQLLVAMGGGWWDAGIVGVRKERAPDPELPQ